jgi:YggT family protein
MTAPVLVGSLFLINTLFDLYLFVFIMRIILVYTGANYFNPFTQFIVKLTDFLVVPLRRLIPNMGRIETSSILLILILEILKFYLVSSLSFGNPNVIGIIILALSDMLKLLIMTFFYAIILQAILSWIQPYAPINRILHQITAPIMRPLQRIIPPVGGFDISPIPALIGLQLLIILLINPLMAFGLSVAVS